jgi:nucleotide-binding universal stress UspA family protein
MEIDERIKEDVAKARTIEIEESEKIIGAAKASLEGRFSRITGIAKSGDPSLEILSESETVRPDLIAMGSRGMKGMKGMLGSVSRRILGHSPCPILVGKAAETL